MKRYTNKEHEFLKMFIPGHTYKEIAEEFNLRFEEPVTVEMIKGYMSRHKINNGLTGRFKKGNIPHNKGKPFPSRGRTSETQFKKGNVPHNTKFVGYERITKDGYIEIRLPMLPGRKAGDKNFVLKHRYVWEQEKGPIPTGYIVTFKDGNKLNCDINNLALISRAEHLELTRQKLRSNIGELTETGILIVKNDLFIRKKKGCVRK